MLQLYKPEDYKRVIEAALLVAGEPTPLVELKKLFEEDFDDAALTRLFNVNLFAGLRIAQAYAKALRESHARGRLLLEASALDRAGYFISPGAVEVARFERSADEAEIFGPFVQFARARDLDDAIAQANATNFGLAASLFSSDEEQWRRFMSGCRAGCVNWNTGTAGASSKLPFGGLGRSGNHRPAGAFAVDSFDKLTLAQSFYRIVHSQDRFGCILQLPRFHQD
jgi:acyl-CoA reductase-like NAD-dependent aldehyde dehydrogenase